MRALSFLGLIFAASVNCQWQKDEIAQLEKLNESVNVSWANPIHNLRIRGAFESGQDIIWDGEARTWDVYVPDGYNPAVPMPLLLALHPLVTGGRLFDWVSDMSSLADREGFLIAYPNGLGNSWNAGPACCPPANSNGVDDLGFMRVLLRAVLEKYNVDRRRVYSHGYSNGGYLLARLLCDTDFANFITAAATSGSGSPFAPEGMIPNGCRPTRPIPVFHMMGGNDAYERAEDYVRELLVLNNCEQPYGSGERTYENNQAFCDSYTQCAPSNTIPPTTNITFCTAGGQGHSWPAYNPTLPNIITQPSRDIDNSQENWAFFAQYQFAEDPPLP